MKQILHIFQKDARKHWLEILISLSLLALYTRHQSPLWPQSLVYWQPHVSTVFLSITSGLITPALVLFWGSLILRVVQDETLVGDRQWWVTKPYVWWKLLPAKLLFVVVFISFPLFIAQLYLLGHAGFPVVSNLPGVARMQFVVPLIIILISLLLACLTRNLGQALVGIGLAILFLIFAFSVSSAASSHEIRETSKLWNNIQIFLLLAPFLVVPIWQFARRKTWASRSVLIGCVIAAILVSFVPGATIERSYSLVPETLAPVKFSLSSAPQKKSTVPSAIGGTVLNLPLDVSGIAQSTLVVVEDMEVHADSAQDSRWSYGWQPQRAYLWPENEHQTFRYGMKQEEYEQAKSKILNLHVQFLLSEFKDVDEHVIRLSADSFHDPFLGVCRINPTYPSALECFRPLREPSYIARFDEATSPCLSAEDRMQNAPPGWGKAYASMALDQNSAPSAALNPVVQYQLYFTFGTVQHSADENPPPKHDSVTFCPGAEIQIMQPKFQRRVRVQIDLPQRRLEEFAVGIPGGSGGTSYDLRSIL